MLRGIALLMLLATPFLMESQWVLDSQWAQGGRSMAPSDRWEVPVALGHDAARVHMLSAAYDAEGNPEARWRAWNRVDGAQIWSGSGFAGETPVDLNTSYIQDRWFLFSEAPEQGEALLSNVWRIRAFQAETPDLTWGEEGALDLGFVGPWHDGGSMDMVGPDDLPEKADAVGPWMVLAGAAYDSCCAHRELPALALLSVVDGTFHPDFGEAGRVVLEPDGWLVEDSVRHEWSGRFSRVLFVPTTVGTADAPPTEMRILAGGTVATSGAFHPFVARFHFDGSLDTEFGNEGVIEWLEAGDINHGIQDMQHHWTEDQVSASVAILVGVPGGEQTLADGTLSLGGIPLDGQVSGAPTADVNPGLPVQSTLRSVGLAEGLGGEGEKVAVGTLGNTVAWDGECHPVWWTAGGSANGLGAGSLAFWSQDTQFDQHRVGAVRAVGSRLFIAGTLTDDTPLTSRWILSSWKAASVSLATQGAAPLTRLYPNPTAGLIHWRVPKGRIECRDALGRLIETWRHSGGQFSTVLPEGAAWIGHNGGGWQAVKVVR